MRIALVVHQYLPEHVGGTEVYTWSLAEALVGLGHEVTVFYPALTIARDQVDDVDSHRVWRSPVSLPARLAGTAGKFWRTFRNPAIERSYKRMLRSIHPDVIHVQHLQNVSARLLSLGGPTPVFLTLHDYWLRCATGQLLRVDGSRCDGPSVACAECASVRAETALPAGVRPLVAFAMGYRNVYLTWLLTHVDRFIAPSAFVRDVFVSWGFDPARITTLAHGVDPDRLHFADSQYKHAAGRLVLGYLGSIAPSKGILTLLQAFDGLPPDAELRIYGPLDTFPAYVDELKALSRHPGIRWMGELPQRAIGDALVTLDYLLVPSLAHETYSLVVDEAHALGVPVVASRLGALTRITDGVSGRLFEAGNITELRAILRDLYANSQLRQQYATAIPRVPTIREQAERLCAMYRAALPSPSGSGASDV